MMTNRSEKNQPSPESLRYAGGRRRDRRAASAGVRYVRSALTVAFAMYLPFSWLLLIDYPWNNYRFYWLTLTPILPGFLVAALARNAGETFAFAAAGLTTALMLIGFTIAGGRNRQSLLFAALSALIASGVSAFLSYAAFQV